MKGTFETHRVSFFVSWQFLHDFYHVTSIARSRIVLFARVTVHDSKFWCIIIVVCNNYGETSGSNTIRWFPIRFPRAKEDACLDSDRWTMSSAIKLPKRCKVEY